MVLNAIDSHAAALFFLAFVLLSQNVFAADIYVSPTGNDTWSGQNSSYPVLTINRALQLINDPGTDDQVSSSATINLLPGYYNNVGGGYQNLLLEKNTRRDASITIRTSSANAAKLNWMPGGFLVRVTKGKWKFENIQIGTGSTSQPNGIQVEGNGATLTLKNVSFETRGNDGAAGIYATRGAHIYLDGSIYLNSGYYYANQGVDTHTFSGITADHYGVIESINTPGIQRLMIGNGSLYAAYYGVIELGFETVQVASSAYQANCIMVEYSGRIDLKPGSEANLHAWNTSNTPLGLEDDGHVITEGAVVNIYDHGNTSAIVLQKSSVLTGNTFNLSGAFQYTIDAMSGSTFVGAIGSYHPKILQASTGAHISLTSHTSGSPSLYPTPPQKGVNIIASKGGSIALPDSQTYGSITK